MAQSMGAAVVVRVQPELAGLVRSVSADLKVVTLGDDLPDFDFHCPMMSLPLAFGTSLATVPASPRYLTARNDLLEKWANILGPRNLPRVGIAWTGRATHRNDAERSIGFEQLRPLLSLPMDFHCLQKEMRLVPTGMRAEESMRVWSGELRDFDDTAALVEQLDFVISVDTAVAHLAAALGKPTWILLPRAADFRWLMDREDSPWYPSVKLFRQDDSFDWGIVLDRVAAALRQAAFPRRRRT